MPQSEGSALNLQGKDPVVHLGQAELFVPIRLQVRLGAFGGKPRQNLLGHAPCKTAMNVDAYHDVVRSDYREIPRSDMSSGRPR
jgi:hypothetical protein